MLFGPFLEAKIIKKRIQIHNQKTIGKKTQKREKKDPI